MSTKTMKEKAAELLQKCEVVTLASVNKEGYPRPVPMSKIAAEGISTIWMSTGADSLKTIDFLSNPKAGLCFQEKGDSVALMGEVEVVTDEKLKQELWQDWFIEHFPGNGTFVYEKRERHSQSKDCFSLLCLGWKTCFSSIWHSFRIQTFPVSFQLIPE